MKTVAVHFHIYYEDIALKIIPFFRNITPNCTIFVTSSFELSALVKDALRDVEHDIRYFMVDNAGRDIWPFFYLIQKTDISKYGIVLKVHTKRSPHRGDGEIWGMNSIRGLIGSLGLYEEVLRLFSENPQVGMVGREDDYDFFSYGGNRVTLGKVLARLGIFQYSLEFFAGSMFWIRGESLSIFRKLNLCVKDFIVPKYKVDGLLEHSLERAIGVSIRKTGYDIFVIDENNHIADTVRLHSFLNLVCILSSSEEKNAYRNLVSTRGVQWAISYSAAVEYQNVNVSGSFCFWIDNHLAASLDQGVTEIGSERFLIDGLDCLVHLERAFSLENYVSVHGAPVVLVRGSERTNPSLTLWKQRVCDLGFRDLKLIYVPYKGEHTVYCSQWDGVVDLHSIEGDLVSESSRDLANEMSRYHGVILDNLDAFNENSAVAIDFETIMKNSIRKSLLTPPTSKFFMFLDLQRIESESISADFLAKVSKVLRSSLEGKFDMKRHILL